jgi:uncharacterized membrane protein YhhN
MISRRPHIALPWIVGATGAAIAALVVAVYLGHPAAGYLKMMASTGFLAVAVAAGALQTRYGQCILAGLFFSWWGDLFLNSSGASFFLFGLVAFLLAHLAYIAAFVAVGLKARWAGGGLALAGAVSATVTVWLYPQLGDMRYPVLAYNTVITLMVVLAAGATGRHRNAWLLTGAVLFYVSDLFVARQRFMTPSPWNSLIGLPVYFIAQVILACSIRTLQAKKQDAA